MQKTLLATLAVTIPAYPATVAFAAADDIAKREWSRAAWVLEPKQSWSMSEESVWRT